MTQKQVINKFGMRDGQIRWWIREGLITPKKQRMVAWGSIEYRLNFSALDVFKMRILTELRNKHRRVTHLQIKNTSCKLFLFVEHLGGWNLVFSSNSSAKVVAKAAKLEKVVIISLKKTKKSC